MSAVESPFVDASLQAVFNRLRAASRASVQVSERTREQRLDLLMALLNDHGERFVQAIAADFGHRSAHETRLLELFPAAEALRHARRHLTRWMKTKRRPVSLWFQPGRARLIPQPLGVVGIIVPWNYPLLLAVAPLIAALAAGNRVMLKMSEFTPRTGALLAELVARYFKEDEVAVILGDAAVGASFAGLPFDHLLFTGSTSVGHHIMRTAAANLTPVTLELGGKSPVIIGPDYPMEKAAERILMGKLLNAGQTCIAPDYLLVPAGRQDEFLAAARAFVARAYPDIARSADYTAIVNTRHFERLSGYLADAMAHGARVEPLTNAAADVSNRRLPPLALLQVTDDMRVMRDEIFGPLLPIVPYGSLDEAIAYVNARPRPLALYVFDKDQERVERLLHETVAGGVTVNDTILHIAQEELPFGGVGPSGMGQYHGEEGFKTFSKLKPVFFQSAINGMGLFNPPYGKLFDRLAALLLRR